MTAPREDLAKLLAPLLPRTWKIKPHQTAKDELSATTVMLKQMRFERLPEAPQSHHAIEFVVTIWSVYKDVAKAEDDLDDAVNTLIHAIDAIGIRWTSATKVAEGTLLGYDITLTLVSSTETGASS